ncbi:MAG: hypothetical protein HY847_08310 [Betaproteobacteria bacterium]|nr:hypothetical protein [Betaproteobacteria bacterium]
MSEAKIEFKLGSIEFSGEGDKDWVSQQLDKIIQQAPKLLAIAPIPLPAAITSNDSASHSHQPMPADPAIASQPLATFLKGKTADKNQVKKFLATAVWLEAKGKTRISSADITAALKASNQTRIGNPALCLSRNISKGHCEKDGNQFFVTTDGKASL